MSRIELYCPRGEDKRKRTQQNSRTAVGILYIKNRAIPVRYS
jgi:hypothetical protein